MDGWKLLGSYSEEEERRPLELRLAEREERSLLLHEGIVYDLREHPMDGKDNRYVFTLRPMAGIDQQQEGEVRRRADDLCRSEGLDRFSHSDEEVAKHVMLLRRAKIIETFLSGFDPTDRSIWFRFPLVS